MMAPASGGTGAHAELALGEDESLPWLEADDYEDAAGVDTARIIGFAVVLLALLAAIIGGVWWFTSRDGDVARVADGSTICCSCAVLALAWFVSLSMAFCPVSPGLPLLTELVAEISAMLATTATWLMARWTNWELLHSSVIAKAPTAPADRPA